MNKKNKNKVRKIQKERISEKYLGGGTVVQNNTIRSRPTGT